MDLNERQARFVEEYLIDLNATQAAIRAGYSEKTAHSQGPRLLENVEVSAAVEKAIKARSDRTEITQDMVLKEYAKIGFADIRKAVSWGSAPEPTDSPEQDRVYPVELMPSEDMDDDTAAAVSEVSLTQAGVKIKMYDKKGALDSIGKHLGMFTEKVEVTGKDGGSIKMEEVSGRDRLSDLLTGIATRSTAGKGSGEPDGSAGE